MDKLASLGIDPWSILLYFINTGVMIAVLTYFLYRPIIKFIDDRRDQIKGSIEESQLLRDEFAKKLKESERAKEKVEEELRQEIQNLNKFIETKRAELIADMETAKTKMLDKAQKEINDRKDALIKDAEKDVMNLMTKIILDIVQNKVPETVIQDSIQESWTQYNKK
jgi:F-type H+-transporting ATPase subunit b